MTALLLVSVGVTWVALLLLAFYLLGLFRALEVLKWQLAQSQAVAPVRAGRSGLKPGKQAPGFTLPRVGGGDVSLADYSARQVLLVFVQMGCSPCHAIAPELNRLHRAGKLAVLVVNNGDAEAGRRWA